MKSLFSKYVWVVQICLLLFGLLLILLSNLNGVFQQGGVWSVSFLSIGISVLTTVLLTIIYSVSKTDAASIIEQKLNFQSRVFDMGLDAVHLGIGDESIFDRFPRAHSIDMMYNTAKNCTFRHGNRIENAIITNGCRVRILIADVETKALQDSSVVNALCPGTDIPSELRDVTAHIQLIKERLERHFPPLKAGSLELRKYSFVPTNSIVIVDGEVARHTPYLPHYHSSEVPIFDVTKERGGKLFMVYYKVFNEIWDQSTVILKVDFGDYARLKPHNFLALNKS